MYLETTGAVDTPIRSTAGGDSIWEFRGDEREVDVYSVHDDDDHDDDDDDDVSRLFEEGLRSFESFAIDTAFRIRLNE